MTNWEELAGKFGDKAAAVAALGEFQAGVESASPDGFAKCLTYVPKVVEAVASKDKATATAAAPCLKAVYEKCPAWAACKALPLLQPGLEGKAKPQTKEIILDILKSFAERCPLSMGREIEDLVFPVTALMTDIKASVAKLAKEVMTTLCGVCGNKDLEPFIPVVVKANENVKNVPECVEKLAGCIFVQNVEAPALAVMIPVLWRGLNDKSESTKRRCCVIVDNMCKLIDDPREGSPLMAEIHPLIVKCTETIADPEAREKAEETLVTVEKIKAQCDRVPCDTRQILENLDFSTGIWSREFMAYLDACCNSMVKGRVMDADVWAQLLGDYMGKDVIEKLMDQMHNAGEEEEEEFIDEDENAPDLYKGSFSLAYGTLTLLRDTKLHLKKFKFYGLLGPNNCGKTTMMRAIAHEQVEGFPKRDELRTVFVEHEVPERELLPPGTVDENGKKWDLGKFNIDLSGIDFVVDMCNEVYNLMPRTDAATVEKALGEIGFKNKLTGVNPKAAADMCNPITTYSGGWKVKMQLAAAKLMDADILMLDEPTGHLDVKNIAWLKDWLRAFRGSIIAVSADRFFLEEMTTHMIWFEDRKLKQFKGDLGKCLTQWVTKYPEKESYFALTNKNLKFNFPAPGPLEGVKSKGPQVQLPGPGPPGRCEVQGSFHLEDDQRDLQVRHPRGEHRPGHLFVRLHVESSRCRRSQRCW